MPLVGGVECPSSVGGMSLIIGGVECPWLVGWNALGWWGGMPLVGGWNALGWLVECPSSVGVGCPLWLEHSWGDASLVSVPLGMETACSGGCLLLKGG